MKNIFLVNNDSLASLYGIGTFVNNFKKECSKNKNIFLSIICLNSNSTEFEIEIKDRIKYYYIPKSEISGDAKYIRNVFYIMYSYIEKEEGERILLLNYSQHSVFAYLSKKYIPNIKIHVVVHYMNWAFILNGNISKLKEIIFNEKDCSLLAKQVKSEIQKEKKIYNIADKLYCLSVYSKNILVKFYELTPTNIHIIPNKIENKYIHLNKTQKDILKKELLLNKEEKILLYVGRIDKNKGIKYLLEAFRKIINFVPNIRLIIVGSGCYDQVLQTSYLIWPNVTLTGKIPQEIVYKFYQVADIGILPSLNEQCSYVAIEMMMFGLPIITTNSTGLKEMFEPIGLDMIDVENFEIGNEIQEKLFIENLKNKILHYLNNKNLQDISKREREHFKKYYMKPSYDILYT